MTRTCARRTLVRMVNAQDGAASEAARALANQRWRGQVITRAMETIRDRRGELDAEQLADLRRIADGQEGPGDD